MQRLSPILSLGTTCLVLTVFGCGAGGSGQGKVSGKIRYKGQELTTGTISFYDDSEKLVGSSGISKGTYLMEKVPPGRVRVTVFTPPATPGAKELPKDPALLPPIKTVPVPAKYNTTKTSGLTYTVTAGEQTKDFPLD